MVPLSTLSITGISLKESLYEVVVEIIILKSKHLKVTSIQSKRSSDLPLMLNEQACWDPRDKVVLDSRMTKHSSWTKHKTQ